MLNTVVELVRGRRGLARTLVNMECSSITLEGCGIELGAKNGRAPHYRYFKYGPNYSISYADLNPAGPDVTFVDLEKPLPYESCSQNFVLLMSVLNHVYNYRQCIEEIARILKPGGRFIGWNPGLVVFAEDPKNYGRLTEDALSRLFLESGFTAIDIRPLYRGPFSAAFGMVRPWFKFHFLRLTFTMICLGLDALVRRVSPRAAQRYPLVYFWTADKSEK